jgi:hypothetical protein
MNLDILQNLKSNDIHQKPYPYLYIENALPIETYEKLYENFPVEEIKNKTKLIENHTHRLFSDDVLNKNIANIPSIWKDFFEYHTSQEFYNKVLNLFPNSFNDKFKNQKVRIRGTAGADDDKIVTDTQFVIHRPHETTTRTTHLDNPLEMYAGLFYLRQRGDNGKGGEFQIYETDEITQVYFKSGREILDNQPRKLIRTIPYKENSFVMFINTNKSTHGVTPRTKTLYDRLSINIIAEIERRKDKPLFMLEEIER